MAKDVARAEQVAAMRAADADRQQIADRLRAALDEGRLSLAEFDERVRQAYAARTYADLLPLMADLPQAGLKADDVHAQAAAAARRSARRLPTALLVLWTIWAAIAVFTVTIWLLAVVTLDEGDPWPLWLLAPTGGTLLAVTVGVQAIRRQRVP